MKNNSEINLIIEQITLNINSNWSNLHKIRYIYLNIGKYLCKDEKFFFSVEGKLGDENLTSKEIKKIYNSLTGRSFNNKIAVNCRSAAYILHLALKKINIKSKLIKTEKKVKIYNDINYVLYHWVLAIFDEQSDETKIYFAVLTQDLPRIQMNFPTKKFGVDIPFLKEFNGKIYKTYKGKKLNHTYLSQNLLQKIDDEIGYIKTENYEKYKINKYQLDYNYNYLNFLTKYSNENKLLYEIECESTSLYKNLTIFKKNNKIIHLFNNYEITLLNKEDWNFWISLLCQEVLKEINCIIGYEILNYNYEYFNYEKWFNIVQSKLKKIKQKCTITKILNKLDKIVYCITKENDLSNFNQLFFNLNYCFIEKRYLYEENITENNFISSEYIANKFMKIFPRVFNCNNNIIKFNKMEIIEQLEIIKNILIIIFPEINEKNSNQINDYQKEYEPIFNRIHLYLLKYKKSNDYCILFNIVGKQSNNEYFLYNTKTNSFNHIDINELKKQYIIISNRLKKLLLT